ncbi:conjugal transfer relaxosome component TraJ [Legionella pneumophila]|nr:conjugal transfer relaxosome component TraJ [Legionella pneumophila]
MDDKLKTPTRKNGRHLRVPVLPSEEIQIKSNAATAGSSPFPGALIKNTKL